MKTPSSPRHRYSVTAADGAMFEFTAHSIRNNDGYVAFDDDVNERLVAQFFQPTSIINLGVVA
jgi:hypothetical protein